MAPYIKKIVFVYVMAAVLTSHVDSPQRDASGSNSNKRTDQTNFLHNEHPVKHRAKQQNGMELSKSIQE